MENMLGSHGWGRMERAIRDEIAELRETTLDACKTTEALAFRRGQVEVLERFARFADSIQAQRTAAEAVASPLIESGHDYEA
jgi:hypothetical protein